MFMGEHVSAANFGDMEWVDFEEGMEDRIATQSFLGRFGNTIGYCTMNEDGDVFALDDDSAEGEQAKPYWRAVEPDMVLVLKK